MGEFLFANYIVQGIKRYLIFLSYFTDIIVFSSEENIKVFAAEEFQSRVSFTNAPVIVYKIAICSFLSATIYEMIFVCFVFILSSNGVS